MSKISVIFLFSLLIGILLHVSQIESTPDEFNSNMEYLRLYFKELSDALLDTIAENFGKDNLEYLLFARIQKEIPEDLDLKRYKKRCKTF